MGRTILITPSPRNLGHAHQVGRNQWSGRLITLRCPGQSCGRVVFVDLFLRIPRHPVSDGNHYCRMSGVQVVDNARKSGSDS